MMVNVRAYRFNDRMIVQFFDSGQRNNLCCPECGWNGALENLADCSSACAVEVECPVCSNPLAMLSSPMGVRLERELSLML